MSNGEDLAVLAEVVDVLAQFGHLRCAPDVVLEDGVLTLTLVVPPQSVEQGDGVRFDTLSLYDELKYVVDFANLRALAQTFDIAPSALEALLPKERT